MKVLVEAFKGLAGGRDKSIAIESLPGFISVGGISVIARLIDKDVGVKRLGGSSQHFEWFLSSSAWEEVAELAAPLSVFHEGHRHQWLDDRTETSVLITNSNEGRW